MPKNTDSIFDKIPSNKRGFRLLSVGIKSGIKAAGSAFEYAKGKKTREQISEDLIKSTVENFVKEVEKLKGGVMKAGQLLSVYGEHFLSPEVNLILKKLQSSSKPVSFKVMKGKIHRAFNQDFDQITIDPNPVGAASLGQVYKAKSSKKLIDQGYPEYFAIKVQYPNIAKSIESDLNLLRKLINLTKIIPDIDRFDHIYEEIKSMLKKEVDYNREAKNYNNAQKLLKDHPVFISPKVYNQFSTPSVLTMDFIEGVRLDDHSVQSISQQRRNALAYHFTDLLFKEIFLWKTVQTDPHIGNFLIQLTENFPEHKNDKIALLDYGAVRKFPSSYIEGFRLLAIHAIELNYQQVIDAGIKLGFLKQQDSKNMFDLFYQIITKATYPFCSDYDFECYRDGSYTEQDYDWSNQTLINELSSLAKNAVFSFKLRPPPKEAVFLDRKLVSSVTLLKVLNAKFSPRRLALSYLKPKKNNPLK